MSRKLSNLFFLFTLVLIAENAVAPQTTADPAQQQRAHSDQSLDNFKRITDQNRPFGKRLFSAKERALIIREIEAAEFQDEAQKLSPPNELFEKFAAFLSGKDTGLAKIFPYRKDCDFGATVSVEEIEKCAEIPYIKGGGSVYSFRTGSHLNSIPDWSDIAFRDGTFFAGGGLNLGLITELADTDLDAVTKQSEGVKPLLKFKPPKKGKTIEKYRTNLANRKIDGFSSSAAVRLNSVYAMRLVAYQFKGQVGLDERVDVIVAFKVVAENADGSVVLLWKILRNKESPFVRKK